MARNVFDFLDNILADSESESDENEEESEQEDGVLSEIMDEEEGEHREPVRGDYVYLSSDGQIGYLLENPRRQGRAAAANVVRNVDPEVPKRSI